MSDRSDSTEHPSVHDLDSIEDLLGAAVKGLGGTTRPNQVKMSRAVASAFARERHLAVQAGTGTGKSLAYLVPAIVQAMETDEPVIISTATIALQRQLVERDLPRLVESLEPHLSRTPTFAILKGRSNYLCKSKVGNVIKDPVFDDDEDAAGIDASPTALLSEAQLSRTAAEVMRLRQWANDTDTGDRDSLDKGVSNEAWRQVSVTARECVGAISCPFGEECFAEAARREASQVDIVVTNHALLAIDALSDAMILPQHDCVVIDEAHELDARITSVATDELSPAGITMMARRARKFGAAEQVDDVIDATDMLGETVASLADDYSGALEEIPGELGMALASLRDNLWQLQTTLGTAGSGSSGSDSKDSDNTERQTVRAAVENMHDTVVRILEFDSDDVIWLGDSKSIFVAPLSIAALLRERLFGESTVVLTSATLALGGKFDAMAAAWGLPSGVWDGLDVGTPFDPKKSGILYVARDLPRPGRDGATPQQFDIMERLIRSAGGRTLGLFSSRRGAEAAAEEMRKRLPYDVLCQGDDSIGALVDRFAADPETCLFGTLTLWQGVDVPGPNLSCVIIDRIPFPRPDDPLLSARSDAANAAGRNGFMEVSATHAALLMAQGSGRLLRQVDDRGVVAVLDSRLATARYGSWIAASMPDFWRTTDLNVAAGALTRLTRDSLLGSHFT
ncbi:MAG: ATP-dependent DNA helicase [Corynebacterium sp.]|uniref:ATP-dependent DNA helicase n=1 Tax=Corynebacterium sp. TaxID=1720 RepID=UPI0026DC9576|nr:ATP-dependent DNA helicase [Corynebacterium sp.]MDO5030736.1 ATP-dependent DNA helicase [Corynebacterium sp.]